MKIHLVALCIGLGLFTQSVNAQPPGERTFFSIGGSITGSILLNKPKSSSSLQYFTTGGIMSITPLSFAYYTSKNIAIYTDFSILDPATDDNAFRQANIEKKYGDRFYNIESGTTLGSGMRTAFQFRAGVGYRKIVKYWHFAPSIRLGLISTETSYDQIQLKERNTNRYYRVGIEQKTGLNALYTLSPNFTLGLRPRNKAFRFNFEIGYSWITGVPGYQSTLTNLLDRTTVTQSERQGVNGHYLTIGGGVCFDINKRIRSKEDSTL